MQKTSCGILLATATLASNIALAQSNVTVYGLVDSGVEYVNNINAAGDSIVRVPSLTGSFPSRIGFRGTEDLGGDLKAVFVLETGLALDTGNLQQGGRLFGRQAYVGLKSSAGTLMLGRQLNMTYLASLKADVMGPNIHAIGSIDGYLPNARSDNAIGYLGTFGELSTGATYSFGRDASAAGGPAATNCAGEVAGNAKACRQVTAMLAYDSKPFGAAGAYDILYGNTGAAGGLTSSNYNDRRVSLNGYVFAGQTKIGLGMVDRKIHAATEIKSELYYLGASVPFAPDWTLDTQVARYDVKDTDKVSTLLTARVSYNFSKRTAAYASLGQMRNAGSAAIAVDAGGSVGMGMNQTGLMTGLRHSF